MKALKKNAAVPVAVALCIALMWGLGAITFATSYQTASQSTSASRLSVFSRTVFALIHNLQYERAAAAGYLSTGRSAGSANLFKTWSDHVDNARAGFRKSIGRFNSDDYGQELTSALRRADELLDGIGDMRMRISETTVVPDEVVAYYTQIISNLSESVFPLEKQKLERAPSDQSRKAYLAIVRVIELASRDMAEGTLFLDRWNNGAKQDGAWRQISADESALLAEYRSVADAEQRALFDAWSNSNAKSAADKMRTALTEAPSATAAGGDLTVTRWLQVLGSNVAALNQIAWAQQRDFIKSVGGDAARAAYLFVALTVVASLATLVAVAWFRPASFRHALFALLLVGNLALISWAQAVGPDWLVKESGPIESLQAFALAAAFFIFCANIAGSRDVSRVAAIAFTCTCFLLFFREFDFRVYGAPEWLVAVSTGPVRRVLYVAIIAVLLLYVATQWRHFTAMVRPFLKWDAWPLLLWLPLLLVGEMIEVATHATRKDALLGYWANGEFWEELLELNAYLVLLFGAYVFAEIFGLRTKQDSVSRLTSFRNALAARKS